MGWERGSCGEQILFVTLGALCLRVSQRYKVYAKLGLKTTQKAAVFSLGIVPLEIHLLRCSVREK